MEPGGRTGHCISRPGCFETAETPQNGCRARTRVELLLKPRRVAIESAAATPKASLDRKSTRLNSSHSQISYAVFCLKKKINSTLTSLGTLVTLAPRCMGVSFDKVVFFVHVLAPT